MKSHGIFVLLLITGVLGFRDVTVNFTDLNFAARSVFQTAGTKHEYHDPIGIIRLVEKTCEKNGGVGAFMIAVGKFQKTQECIVSLYESITVKYFMSHYSEEQPETYMEARCSVVSSLESCVNEFKKNNPCLGPVELESVDVYRDVVISAIKVFCNNEREIFEKPNSGESQRTALSEMSTCYQQELEDTVWKRISEANSTSEPQKLPWHVPDKDDCAKLERFQQCHVKALQRYKIPEITNMFKDLYSEVLVEFRCRNLANLQSSPVSSSGNSSIVAGHSATIFNPNSFARNVLQMDSMEEAYNYATVTDYRKTNIMRLLNETCEKNGGVGAFLIAVGKIQKIQHCIKSLKESIDVNYSYITKHPIEGPEVVIEAFCPRVSSLESCIDEFKKDNLCLGPAELESIDVYRDVVISSLKFACNNEGDNFRKLINGGGIECLEETLMERQTCYKRELKDMVWKRISEVTSTSKTRKLPWRVLENDDCANLEKFQECNLIALQRCKKPEVTNVMKGLYNEIFTALRCRNSANSIDSKNLLYSLLDGQLEKFQECHLNALEQCKKLETINLMKDLYNEIQAASRCRNSTNS